jgi:Na+/proline symporter
MDRNWFDLIGGLFLVPVLHFGFLLLMLLIYASMNYNSVTGSIFFFQFFWIGIAQFIYLIPVMLSFRRRERFEVVKGISIGAILTVFVNGVCFGNLSSLLGSREIDAGEMIRAGFITTILCTITFYGFNYRSRPK